MRWSWHSSGSSRWLPPPLPDWADDHDASDDSEDLIVVEPVADVVAPGNPDPSAPPRVDCVIGDEAPPFNWSDASQGTVALLLADSDTAELWLVATGRIGNEVVHWQQGPFAADQIAEQVAVELPGELLASTHAARDVGTLSVRVVAQDLAGNTLSQWPLPRLTWTLRGSSDGTPVLGTMDDAIWIASDDGTISADL